MKKINFLIILATSLMAASCDGDGNTAADNANSAQALAKSTCPSSAYNEPELEYGDSIRSKPNVYLYRSWEITTGEQQFIDNFKYRDSKTNFPKPIFKMQYTTLKSIFDSLNSVRPNGADHIAIRFYYGIQDGAMDLILQPIFLTPVPGDNCEEYSQDSVNIFYSMKRKEWISKVSMEQLTKSYRDNIYVNHVDTATKDFINDTDFFRGDTHYAITPFQQIFRMYCDNGGKTSDSISFQIVADSFYRTVNRKVNNFKLHVVSFLEGKVLTNPPIQGVFSFAGYSADFDQMCPPKCAANVRLNYYEWERRCATLNIAKEKDSGKKVINIETP
jgi:hypothetical protein